MRAGEGLLPEQARAARHPGSLAVVAGAGTGKTHMLAHRYLYHLEQGLDPLEIVAVTFTERAAAELRSRIRELVRQGMEGRPDVSAALEAAQISTLHALAARICRDHPDAAGAPPDFTVLDELEGQLWLAERLDEALSDVPPEVFEDLPYPAVRAALQDLLRDPVQASAGFAQGPERWPELVSSARAAAVAELTRSAGWREAAALVRGARGEPGDRAEAARAAAQAGLEQLGGGAVAQGLAALDGVRLVGGRAAAWPRGDLEAVKDALRTLRGAARAALAEGVAGLELGEPDDRLAELLPVLRRAFDRVRERLAAEKRRRRTLDFADLEVFALRALQREEVRGHYRARWRAVLVDEFQDTNPVQERLLDLLTEGMTVTVVGDEKQSVYGFRGADVEVFRRYRRRLAASPGGAEVVMDRSFRAHRALTATVNGTFEQVLGELHQELTAVRESAPHPGPHVALRLVSGKDGKARRLVSEARLIAGELRRLLDAETPVWDKEANASRPLRPDDIAVLTRTWQPLAVYGEILPALGVPAVHTGGGNLLDTREAKDGAALLRFVADPGDDVALAAVLRSPFFAVDDPTLYRFARQVPFVEEAGARRPGTPYAPWWETLRAVDDPAPALARARSALDELLAARGWPPGRILQLADALTGYTAVLGGMPGAERRLADWTGFLELVRSLERGMGDAFSAVRRLRRLIRAQVEVPRPTLRAEGAVSLLTIHRSKGLEWPVVVVADLERASHGGPPAVLFEPRMGVALRLQDAGGEAVEPALYTLLARRRREREAAEARRVLYVALTRARDRLLLTAAGSERGALEVLRPALEAAGVESVEVEHDPALAAYPPPPEPGPGSEAADPVVLDPGALDAYAASIEPRRPLRAPQGAPPGSARSDAWGAAIAVLRAGAEAWRPLAEALRERGAPAPSLGLVDAWLALGAGRDELLVALGWRLGGGVLAVVDSAVTDGDYGAELLRLDPGGEPGALAAEIEAALERLA